MGSYESVFTEESDDEPNEPIEPRTSVKRKLDDDEDTDDLWYDSVSTAISQSKKPRLQKESPAAGYGDVEECPICLEHYTSSDDKTFLPCFHRFHQDCIDQWLAIKNECPICRSVPEGYIPRNTFITKTLSMEDTFLTLDASAVEDTFTTPDPYADVSTAAFVSDPTKTPLSRDLFQCTCISISTWTPDSSSHSTDKSEDKLEDKSGDKSEDKSGDKSEDKWGDRLKDKSKDKSGDKSKDKSKDKSGDKSKDKSKDKSGDISKDKSKDKSGDKSEDKSKDKSGYKSGNKSEDKSGNKSEDKSGDKSKDKSDSSHDSKSVSRKKSKSTQKLNPPKK